MSNIYIKVIFGGRELITKATYDSLVALGKKTEKPNVVGEDTLYLVEDIDNITIQPPSDNYIKAQAREYLARTDFKAQNSSLTPEQNRLRAKAKVLLEGSYVEPPSDLFDV